MLSRLPERIEPLAMAEAGREFSGSLELAGLARLAPLLSTQQGALSVTLLLDRDEAGTRYLAGRVTGQLQLECQRCLGAMEFALDSEFRLGLVRGEEEAARLPSGYEPLLVGTEPMPLAEIVEDEVLLALPIVALHRDPHPCAARQHQEPLPEGEQRENPFAVLAQLKRDK
jgi:uncharacterized protein